VSKRLILFAFGDCSASFQTSYIYHHHCFRREMELLVTKQTSAAAN